MHILDLSDKLITLILTYSGKILGFSQFLQQQQETVHLQFCKKLIEEKTIKSK